MRSYAKHVAFTGAVAALAVAFLGSTRAVRAEQGKTANDGVYSDAQAKKGEALYGEQCASCHGGDLSGGGAPALAGADFLGFWDKTPMADLVEKIQASMPASAPGSLTRAQSAEITAFMLKANKFPAGAADMPADAEALKAISIVKGAAAAASAAAAPAAAATAGLAKTAKDGVYSDAQAKKGEALYGEQCASCHGGDLSGGGAPALAGADFLGFWDKTPMADLVEKIQASMPASAPGSLTRAQSAEITAFMLKANKFPAGAADMPADAEALKAINIVK